MNPLAAKSPILLSAAVAGALVAGAAGAVDAPAPPKRTPPVPCDTDPKYHQFDFWLGAWEVSSDRPGAAKSADATVERVLGGCGLRETWSSARSPTGDGIGMATFSRLTGAWRYFWVSGAGANTDFVGQPLDDKQMQFTVEQPDPSGGKRLRHWTLSQLPDGRLSEVSVGSLDGGKTWMPEYQLFWKKK
jgi:hypothetical protein